MLAACARNSPRPASRSSSIPARGCRCSTARSCWQFIDTASWVDGQRLRRRSCCRNAPARCRRRLAARVKACRHAWRGRQRRSMPTAARSRSRGRAPTRSSIPTGCGDAYRAGLLYGIMHGLDWETTGRIASLMGAIKIAHAGTQNHRFDAGRIQGPFRAAFGRDLWIPVFDRTCRCDARRTRHRLAPALLLAWLAAFAAHAAADEPVRSRADRIPGRSRRRDDPVRSRAEESRLDITLERIATGGRHDRDRPGARLRH